MTATWCGLISSAPACKISFCFLFCFIVLFFSAKNSFTLIRFIDGYNEIHHVQLRHSKYQELSHDCLCCYSMGVCKVSSHNADTGQLRFHLYPYLSSPSLFDLTFTTVYSSKNTKKAIYYFEVLTCFSLLYIYFLYFLVVFLFFSF